MSLSSLFKFGKGSQVNPSRGHLHDSMLSRAFQLKMDWMVPVNQPFMLVTEVQRSGGTLMSQLLDGHSQCFSHPSEVRFNNPKWFWPSLDFNRGTPTDWFEQVDEIWIDEYLNLGYYHKTSRTDADRFPFILDRDLQRRIFFKLAQENPITNQRQMLNYYLTSLFNAWLDYQNLYNPQKAFVTGFVPRLIMYEESILGFFRDYPDGYLISLIRHPASWYSSAKKHDAILKEINKKIESQEIQENEKQEAIMSLWLSSTQASLAAQAKHPDRIITVLFEDVVQNTEVLMRKLCERVGLDYHPIMTQPTYNGIPVESNSHYNAVYHVDASVATRYREILTETEIREVENMALHLYEEARQSTLTL